VDRWCMAWYVGHTFDLEGKAGSWEKIPSVIQQWKTISSGRPFLLNGIQSVDDAVEAVENECDGVVVSGHA